MYVMPCKFPPVFNFIIIYATVFFLKHETKEYKAKGAKNKNSSIKTTNGN